MGSGLRKAKVLPKDLPPVIKLGADNYGYLVRHRVIAEDRNRFSSWSPVSVVPAFDINNLPPLVSGDVNVVNDSVNIVWDDSANRPRYDVFISFDSVGYFYHGTSPIHAYSVLNTTSATQVDVAIQIESVNQERSDVLTICQISATIGV